MLHHRGISPRTVAGHERSIISLLTMHGTEPQCYDAAGIRQSIVANASRYNHSTVRGLAKAGGVSSFLASHSRCRPGLDAAIPTFVQWKASALPRYLSIEELGRAITAFDRRTSCGLRDHSVLLLVSRLDLRAGDILNMRLPHLCAKIVGRVRRKRRVPRMPRKPSRPATAFVVALRFNLTKLLLTTTIS